MSECLLEIEGLRIEADAPSVRPLLEDLNLQLDAGERLAIVGESGSGKTLATRAIPGLLGPGVRRTAGTIRFEGQDISNAPPEVLRQIRGKGIGLVFQEPMTSLNPAIRVGSQLAEGMKLHTDLNDSEIHSEMLAMLRRVHIANAEEALKRFPHEFSGGMRQRIMLASVLLLRPRLLIADEPTTALDTLSQREVLRLMVELTSEMGTGLLLITHDLGLVHEYTDRVIVLEKGVLVEQGLTAEVLRAPSHPYTKKLIGSLPKPRETEPVDRTDAPPVLEIDDLSVEYPGKRGLLKPGKPLRVLEGVDLAVREGEIVALVGASGSGKTTLGRAALGLKSITGGDIRFDGLSIAAMGRRQRYAFRRDAQLIFQDPFSSLDPRLRIGAIVGASLRHTAHLSAEEKRDMVLRVLDEVGLSGFENRFAHEMSGGQRQRIAIARAIVSRPRLVIADEPVSALDLTIQSQVLDLIQTLQSQQGFACIFITHDLSVVEQIADRVVILERGRIVESGQTAEIFRSPNHEYTRKLLEATPRAAAPV